MFRVFDDDGEEYLVGDLRQGLLGEKGELFLVLKVKENFFDDHVYMTIEYVWLTNFLPIVRESDDMNVNRLIARCLT